MDETFTRTIAGRDITFRQWKPGQYTALQRMRGGLSKEFTRIRNDESMDQRKKYELLTDIAERLDLKTITFVESLMPEADEIDFLGDAMLTGEIDLAGILNILFGNVDEPDDDEDPAPVAKKSAPNPLKKAVKAKKTANAQRTVR